MRITQKNNGKRPRVQFYLTEELDKLLTDNRALAKKLGLRIDFQDAFRLWFLRENKDANTQLAKMVKEKKADGNAQAD
jgi:hypothetical protein